jgi:glucose-1-phosphate thymidylyltransferase
VKGILLAGGAGTRLHPVTKAVSKQLLPVYDKPLVYYPLSSLMLAGIRDILVITTPDDQASFRRLLGSGDKIGLQLDYVAQPSPGGIAQAFLLGRQFIGTDRVALALGDNVFYGHDFPLAMRRAAVRSEGATIFAAQVRDPERYGVIEFDEQGVATSIEEKPKVPKSHWAVTGLYFYDNEVVSIASSLAPSKRGELEITDVNASYLIGGKLHVERLGRGIAWLDTGTPESMLQASSFIQTLEERQGLKVGCIEEIAYRMGFIGRDALVGLADEQRGSSYGQYLVRLVEEEARESRQSLGGHGQR